MSNIIDYKCLTTSNFNLIRFLMHNLKMYDTSYRQRHNRWPVDIYRFSRIVNRFEALHRLII